MYAQMTSHKRLRRPSSAQGQYETFNEVPAALICLRRGRHNLMKFVTTSITEMLIRHYVLFRADFFELFSQWVSQ